MNQLCRVCGETAAGYHFGAFTCEGCKSFFGRTYNSASSLGECKNNGRCIINKKNRTTCKVCRLHKCLLVGMSKSGSRYGRRSNWFKIHCLMESNGMIDHDIPSKVGSETSSCGRSSEDEIENNDGSSIATPETSPLRSSPTLLSPTSPRRTSPGLSIPESYASDVSSEVNSEHLLSPSYLSLYQQLSCFPMPLTRPTGFPLQPFFPRTFSHLSPSDYRPSYPLQDFYPSLNHLLPGIQDRLRNSEISRDMYKLNRADYISDSAPDNTEKDVLSIKRKLDIPLEISIVKRTKTPEVRSLNLPIAEDDDISASCRSLKTSSPEISLTVEAENSPEEHPVDLSMKNSEKTKICNRIPDQCENLMILDLSLKSGTLNKGCDWKKGEGEKKTLYKTPCASDVTDIKNLKVSRKEATIEDMKKESENKGTESISDNSNANILYLDKNECDYDIKSPDDEIPSVSISYVSGGPSCPLNLCLKSMHQQLLVSKVS